MADDEFTLEDDDAVEPNAEASLDDFFQPAGETGAESPATQVDPISAPADPITADVSLPIERDLPGPEDADIGAIDDLGADFSNSIPGPAAPEMQPEALDDYSEEELDDKKPSKGLLPDKLLIIIIAALAIGVVGAGGYLLYSFLVKEEEPAITAPEKMPKAVPVAKSPKPKKASDSPDAQDMQAAKADKQDTPVEAPKKAKPARKKPKKAREPKAAPTPEPVKTEKLPKPAKPKVAKASPKAIAKPAAYKAPAKGRYSLQIGAYMLDASKAEPERKLRNLGFSDYHYVDMRRTMGIYDVVVGRGLSKDESNKVISKLKGMGYVPQAKSDGSILVYSYSSKSIAYQTKDKISRAGLGPVDVKYQRKSITLHQLRVGSYQTHSDARTDIDKLRRAGLSPVIVTK